MYTHIYTFKCIHKGADVGLTWLLLVKLSAGQQALWLLLVKLRLTHTRTHALTAEYKLTHAPTHPPTHTHSGDDELNAKLSAAEQQARQLKLQVAQGEEEAQALRHKLAALQVCECVCVYACIFAYLCI
jgi:septal ring factor EnvC (AmiA/AmiB activator)